MTFNQRLIIVLIVFSLDVLIFFLPVMAIFAAYVLFERPLWFRDWIEKLYSDL